METNTPEIEEIKSVEEPKPQKNLKKKIIPVLLLLGVVLIILSVLWLRNAYDKYKNADKYKKSYDIVQQQLKYCSERKFAQDSNATVQVHYCDTFQNKFNIIEKE